MYLIRVLNGSGLIYHARMNLQRPKLLPLWQALTLGAALLTLTPGANAQTVPEKPPAIANSDLNAKIMFFVLMGEYAAVKGDYTGAADYYFQVAREFKHEELFEKAVQYSLKQGSVERLMQVGLSWSLTHPKSGKANLYWLTLLLRMNQHGASLDALKNTLATNDLSTQRALLLDLAKLYGNAQDLPGVVTLVEQGLPPYLKQADTALYAHLGLGQLKLQAGDVPGALRAAQTAGDLEPQNPLTLGLFFRLLEQGSAPASTWLMAQMQQHGDSRVAHAFVSWQTKVQGARVALQTTQSLAALHPANGELGLLLAELQTQASQWSRADQTLGDVMAKMPPSAEGEADSLRSRLQIKQAQVALKLGQGERVDRLLNGTSDTAYYLQKLEIRVAQRVLAGDMEAAWSLLDREPDREGLRAADKHRVFVALLKEHGHADLALAHMDRFIPPGELDKSAQLQRALLLEKSGAMQKALAAYRAVQTRFPKDAEAQNALGFSLADQGIELDHAKALVSEANQTLVGNPMVIDSMGWVEFKRGNLQEALAWLELAASLDPDPEIAAHLGEVYWQMGRRTQALMTWSQAYDKAAPHDTLVRTLARLKVQLP